MHLQIKKGTGKAGKCVRSHIEFGQY